MVKHFERYHITNIHCDNIRISEVIRLIGKLFGNLIKKLMTLSI